MPASLCQTKLEKNHIGAALVKWSSRTENVDPTYMPASLCLTKLENINVNRSIFLRPCRWVKFVGSLILHGLQTRRTPFEVKTQFSLNIESSISESHNLLRRFFFISSFAQPSGMWAGLLCFAFWWPIIAHQLGEPAHTCLIWHFWTKSAERLPCKLAHIKSCNLFARKSN